MVATTSPPLMNPTRPPIFWIALPALVVMSTVLLREVLLPFATGIGLAYLLNPIAS